MVPFYKVDSHLVLTQKAKLGLGIFGISISNVQNNQPPIRLNWIIDVSSRGGQINDGIVADL